MDMGLALALRSVLSGRMDATTWALVTQGSELQRALELAGALHRPQSMRTMPLGRAMKLATCCPATWSKYGPVRQPRMPARNFVFV
jgi:hypothetical protein